MSIWLGRLSRERTGRIGGGAANKIEFPLSPPASRDAKSDARLRRGSGWWRIFAAQRPDVDNTKVIGMVFGNDREERQAGKRESFMEVGLFVRAAAVRGNEGKEGGVGRSGVLSRAGKAGCPKALICSAIIEAISEQLGIGLKSFVPTDSSWRLWTLTGSCTC